MFARVLLQFTICTFAVKPTPTKQADALPEPHTPRLLHQSQRVAAAQWAPATQVAARGMAFERTTPAAAPAAAAAAAAEQTGGGGASDRASSSGGMVAAATAAAAAAALALSGVLAAGGGPEGKGVVGCEAAAAKPAGGGDGAAKGPQGPAAGAPAMQREDSRARTMMPGVSREDSRSAMWPNRDRPSETWAWFFFYAWSLKVQRLSSVPGTYSTQ